MIGLRLSAEKTKIAHIDEGFDFLGRRIQRHRKRGTQRQHVYTYPSKTAMAAIKGKVRAATPRSTDQSLADLEACKPYGRWRPGTECERFFDSLN